MKVKENKVWLLEDPDSKWILNKEEEAIEKIKESEHDVDNIDLSTVEFKKGKLEVKGVAWKEIAVKLMK